MSGLNYQGGVGLRQSTRECAGLFRVLALVVINWAGGTAAADRPAAPQLSAAQQQRLKERDGYGAEIKKLRAEGKLAEAITACEKMLAIERELFGAVHETVAGSLDELAEMHEE